MSKKELKQQTNFWFRFYHGDVLLIRFLFKLDKLSIPSRAYSKPIGEFCTQSHKLPFTFKCLLWTLPKSTLSSPKYSVPKFWANCGFYSPTQNNFVPFRSTYHPTPDHPLKPSRAESARTVLEARWAYRVDPIPDYSSFVSAARSSHTTKDVADEWRYRGILFPFPLARITNSVPARGGPAPWYLEWMRPSRKIPSSQTKTRPKTWSYCRCNCTTLSRPVLQACLLLRWHHVR